MLTLVTHNPFLAEHLAIQCKELWSDYPLKIMDFPSDISFLQKQMKSENNGLFILDIDQVSDGDIDLLFQNKMTLKHFLIIYQKEDMPTRLAAYDVSQYQQIKRPFYLSEFKEKVERHLTLFSQKDDVLKIGDYDLYILERALYYNKEKENISESCQENLMIKLTEKERDILVYLHTHRDKIISREELLQHVFDYHQSVDTHTVGTHIYRLRQKIAQLPNGDNIIQTRAGGYTLSSFHEIDPPDSTA